MGVHHRRAGGILHRDAVLFRGALSHAPQGLRSLLLHGAIPASIANVLLPMVFAIAVACSMRHFPIRTDAGVCGEAVVVVIALGRLHRGGIWASDCCAPAISGLRDMA